MWASVTLIFISARPLSSTAMEVLENAGECLKLIKAYPGYLPVLVFSVLSFFAFSTTIKQNQTAHILQLILFEKGIIPFFSENNVIQ